MLEIDRPFDGLDEVWIWPVAHPEHVITRLGTREGTTLEGRVEIVSKRRRLAGGRRHDLVGLQAWRKADLGSIHFPNTDLPGPPGDCTVRCGAEQASWRSGGVFRVGDHEEDNRIATGGGPVQGGLRDLRDLGRSLVRRVRKQAPDPEPVEDDSDELTAFDRWLVATPVDTDGTVTWRVAIDRHPEAPSSVGLGLVVAAIGLVHARRLP